jgi:hypothetical protein
MMSAYSAVGMLPARQKIKERLDFELSVLCVKASDTLCQHLMLVGSLLAVRSRRVLL